MQSGVSAYLKKGAFTPRELLEVMNGIRNYASAIPPAHAGADDNGLPPSEKLKKIYDFTSSLIALDSLDEIIDEVIRMMRRISRCRRISVMLLSDDDKYHI